MVKQYFRDKLKFEGDYVDGKCIGKEYEKDKIIFEGEYFNGKRHGKGKEYMPNGKLRFEGEYYDNKKMEFDIEYSNGERAKGKVKQYFDDGKTLLFECELKDNELNGQGRHYSYNGNIKFEGEYVKGKRWIVNKKL